MWQDGVVAVKPKKRGRDFAQNALRVVEQAIGEHPDGTPLEDPNAGKNPAAVEFGRLKGSHANIAVGILLSLLVALPCAVLGGLVAFVLVRAFDITGWITFFWLELGAAIGGIAGFALSVRRLIRRVSQLDSN